jgi:hypothetical protein
MSDTSAADRWQDERTTFQRVYDVLVGHKRFSPPESLPTGRRALKPQLATRSNSWPRWALQNAVTGGRPCRLFASGGPLRRWVDWVGAGEIHLLV